MEVIYFFSLLFIYFFFINYLFFFIIIYLFFFIINYLATLLLSKDIYDYLSPPMQNICRQVDNVFLNGEEKGIYSVDL